jgi:Domain of unknown function (DUF4326)
MKPQRIQRKRTKGWCMPPNTVSVTRPGKWGNPFLIGRYYRINAGAFLWLEALDDVARRDPRFSKVQTAQQAVDLFRAVAEKRPLNWRELRGKNLACFCSLDKPCHADVLLELANA